MTAIALTFSLLIAGFGVLGLVSPSRLLNIDGYFQTPAGIYFGSAVRLAIGVVFILAAPSSRAPQVIHVLGAVIVVAGVLTFFLGLKRLRKLIDWWLVHRSALVRPLAAFALIFGMLLAYVFLP